MTDPKRDVELQRIKKGKQETDKKYRALTRLLGEREDELRALMDMQDRTAPIRIPKAPKAKDSVATAFLIASDWHVEERVVSNTVNGLNSYSPKIAEQRAKRFFQNGVRLTKIIQKDIKVERMVLALLGDFISGNIHEELLENCAMPPTEAIVFAQGLIIGGIEYILRETDMELYVVCHSGNHGRITKKTHVSTEKGNSLEYMMYHNIALYFKDEPRVQFQISDGYHSFVYCYGWNIRFHHGHHIRYGGGVGGLTIPANKAIANWNKGMPDKLIADLDVWGHFHQLFDAGNFIVNGSLIGYNAFAKSIKASYERPQQVFFTIDKKRGKTFVCPVIVD